MKVLGLGGGGVQNSSRQTREKAANWINLQVGALNAVARKVYFRSACRSFCDVPELCRLVPFKKKQNKNTSDTPNNRLSAFDEDTHAPGLKDMTSDETSDTPRMLTQTRSQKKKARKEKQSGVQLQSGDTFSRRKHPPATVSSRGEEEV